MTVTLITHSAAETQKLGNKLGKLAEAGDIFLLAGNLGSGKTTFTQGIAWGLGVKEYAFSPSFVLVREYHGRLPLYHVDLYRIDSIEEIMDLALDEYFDGNSICVIEWAEKGLEVLPRDNLLVTMKYVSLNERQIKLDAHGSHYQQIIVKAMEK